MLRGPTVIGGNGREFSSANSDTNVLTHGLLAMAVNPIPGVPISATLTVHNHGVVSEDVFADPRTNDSQAFSALALSPTSFPLPGGNASTWLIPTQTTRCWAWQATAPILLELDYALLGEGDPSVLGNSAAATYSSAPQVGNGEWILAPSLRGPFAGPAPAASVNTGLAIHTRGFDDTVDSSTGDLWRQTVDGNAPGYTPLTLTPGRRGKITLTFTPRGRKGAKVSGVLYVDDFSFFSFTGNEQLAIPYSYTIK